MTEEDISPVKLTPTIFCEEIEKIVAETGTDYTDAVVHFCQDNGLEIEVVPKLLNPIIKQKIQLEAEELNLLPKTSRLPF